MSSTPRNPSAEAHACALDTRLGDLVKRRRFGPRYDALFAEIGARRKMLRERVAAAIRAGRFWGIVKAELARDYQSLFDNVRAIEPGIDADFAQSHTDTPAKS